MSRWFTSIVTYLSVCLTLTLEILQRSLVNSSLQRFLFWIILFVSLTFFFLVWWIIIPNDLCVWKCDFNKTDNMEEQSARASSQWASDEKRLSQTLKCHHVEWSHFYVPPVEWLSSGLLSGLVCFHHLVSQFVQWMYWEKCTMQDKPVPH